MERMIIKLDGRHTSDLNWTQAGIVAEKAQKPILWHLDLGLFSELAFPIDQEAQCRTLGLAIEHFVATLWKKFSENTQGLCLYRGSLDFSKGFPWDSAQEENFNTWLKENEAADSEVYRKLYCRDVAASYFDILLGFTPFQLKTHLLFDAAEVSNPLECALLTAPERFESFELEIENGPSYSDVSIPLGVCIPNISCQKPSVLNKLQEIVQQYKDSKTPFRLIAEHTLLQEWEGLDELIVVTEGLSDLGVRKLQGFEAAGGVVKKV